MEDRRKYNGGNKNAGRKSKADEEKANTIIINALKQIYSTELDEEAKIAFIKDKLMYTQRGQLFIAEHIFGKAPQEVKQTNINIEEKDLTKEEIQRIKEQLNASY